MRQVLLLWLACCGLCCAAPARAEEPMRAAALQPGETLRLDGTLNHPAWQRAPVFSGFVEKDPNTGAAPAQATQVRVLFDAQALYVGISSQDTQPALVRRPLVRHDQVNRTQDFVVVYVDPIGSKRSAQFFRVNAAGSKADGLHTAADDNEDFAPDFDWDAQVASHAQGWTAVMRLPFASLRYASGAQDRWRIMVARRLPRAQVHLLTSVLVPREASNFIERMQPLHGVQLPADPAFLVLRPSLTVRQLRERPAQGAARNDVDVDASLDVKWRPRAELVVDATLNPDFSQVALDVPQLSGNTRFALSIAEKRPFFFESADLLRSPTEAFYTRSFTAPRGGLRATWRGGRLAGSALMVDDRGGGLVLLPAAYGTGAAEQPASRTVAARGRADDGALQWGGIVAARRYAGGRGENSVLGPDVTLALAEGWTLRAQWLHARTTALADAQGLLRKAAAVDGDQLLLRLEHRSDSREGNLVLEDISAGFRHDGGFVGQSGVRKLSLFEAVNWYQLGPLNQLALNLNAGRTEERGSGRTVEQKLYPGWYLRAARNLEWWVEFHALNQLRASPTGPLLAQRYLATGLVFTPATWFPLLDTQLDIGRLADTDDERLRPGVRWTTKARLRPLAPLEVDPTVSTSWLRGDDGRVYDERITNVLAVWHLGPRSHLRAIVQRSQLARDGTRLAHGRQQSLTWSWRPSTGTVFYVGAGRFGDGVSARSRNSELFVKLQLDLDEARAAFR